MSMATKAEIFVLEDDDDVRETILACLEDGDIRAAGAPDGVAGLEWLRETDELPDVILLDLMMPRMNGRQFREQQLADPALADIPVVILSADLQSRSIAASLKAAGCLEKPLKLAQLLATARRFTHR